MKAAACILTAHADSASQGWVSFLGACRDHVTLGPRRLGRGREQIVEDGSFCLGCGFTCRGCDRR